MTPKKIDQSLFQKILDNLYPENEPLKVIGDIAFDKIDILVENHFEENFSQLIINSVDSGTDIRKVAIIFDILVWSTPDNGKKMDEDTKNWLESNNLTKIKCMLFRHDWLPLNQDWTKISKEIIELDAGLTNLTDYYTDELIHWKRTGGRRTEVLTEIIKTTANKA